MIRRSVRKAFHTVHWTPPAPPPAPPAIFVANHHGWHDGYLMYLAATKLGIRVVDWIAEFDSFPLFAKVGGMRFPADDPAARAATIKRTIRLMQNEGTSLLLFAEGILHRPPGLLPFGKALETVSKAVPAAKIVPVAIRYELALHERPEAWLRFGDEVPAGENLAVRTRLAVAAGLDALAGEVRFSPSRFETLVEGTLDINERWYARRLNKS
jgi:1-acyl-sn-glycerol-3-phosphate acyltransferase